jgi:hypothetical protein
MDRSPNTVRVELHVLRGSMATIRMRGISVAGL